MQQIVKWGILGPGAISETFARALEQAEGADLVAVGSRDEGRAGAFARKYDVDRAHGSYHALAADPEIDAIYIGTPHSFHEEHTVLCLSHGKHVLCEKPLAINTGQAGRMIRAAREHDRLLMEAMWTRFLPSLVHVRQMMASGRIGEPRTLTADFGIQPEFDPTSRLFDPLLGGGALLDLGVYAVSMGHWLFGDPLDIKGTAHLGPTGVDDDSAFVLRHGDGQITTAFQSMRVDTPREAVIRGTGGWIRLHEPWWGTSSLTVGTAAGEEEKLNFALKGRGYTHMADGFMELVREGRRDSDVISLEDSLAIMETMDTLRNQWNMKYPME